MADDIDAMLQGTDASRSSQERNEGQEMDSAQSQSAEEQSPEEVDFNKLSGSAQDRFKKAWKRTKELEDENSRLKTQSFTPAPFNPNAGMTTEARQAVEQLAGYGIATDEKVDRKVDAKFNQIRWDLKMDRLENKFSGDKGEPKFVREEVESWMSDHSKGDPNISYYDPEDVFKYKMFPDEFSNLNVERQTTKTGRSSTLRPTRANVQQEAMTPEYIEARLKRSDGKQW